MQKTSVVGIYTKAYVFLQVSAVLSVSAVDNRALLLYLPLTELEAT